LGNTSNTSRKVVTSARVQAYAIGNTNSVTPVTSDSCVDKGGQFQSPVPHSSDGEWRVHGANDNFHSIRDVIDSHDERASELIGDVTTTRTGNSAVVSLTGSALATRSTAVGPESSDAHSSVTNTRSNRGSSNSGS